MSRLTLSLIAAVLMAFFGLGWLMDQWYEKRFPQQDTALDNYKLLAGELYRQLNSQLLTESDLQVWADRSTLSAQISNYKEFPIPADLASSFERGEPLILDSADQVSLHYFLPHSGSVLSLNFPMPAADNHNKAIKWILTLCFYSGVILVLLLWVMPLLRRLDLLRTTAEAVGRGELQRRIPNNGVSYIRDIENEFNAMAARLHNLIQDNKILSRGLSHDLRTPLARLRFGVDVLMEEADNPQQQAKLEHLNRDLWDMEMLVETLLEYSKLEEANIRLLLTPVPIVELVRELIEVSYRLEVTLILQQGVTQPMVLGHAEYLAMLLNNIIQNALRYGAGVIHLTLSQRDNEFLLCLEDNGPGIPEAERQHVLMPFYRATHARNIKGHGMGLALVERIAHWHNARLRLDASASLGGLSVSLQFGLTAA